ncbi:uncharacterized protein LY89DRAFT_742905 [Mollisia scopiformis]|uniref:Uncharacterized protein n=1 Tax=Mollisia scopiformis TaxID=149040 RepID=A0A132B4E0_MOLSC|nr:uncharacterized protein LY89DRAFT_742905 [Mollisia scopiformis]KUJ07256.1 hypothetical protein LY89DRAFT_742905 [Mollisia scopiformis]
MGSQGREISDDHPPPNNYATQELPQAQTTATTNKGSDLDHGHPPGIPCAAVQKTPERRSPQVAIKAEVLTFPFHKDVDLIDLTMDSDSELEVEEIANPALRVRTPQPNILSLPTRQVAFVAKNSEPKVEDKNFSPRPEPHTSAEVVNSEAVQKNTSGLNTVGHRSRPEKASLATSLEEPEVVETHVPTGAGKRKASSPTTGSKRHQVPFSHTARQVTPDAKAQILSTSSPSPDPGASSVLQESNQPSSLKRPKLSFMSQIIWLSL